MAFLDDAVHSGRNTYEHPKTWSRETATAVVALACIAFWGVAVAAFVAFAS